MKKAIDEVIRGVIVSSIRPTVMKAVVDKRYNDLTEEAILAQLPITTKDHVMKLLSVIASKPTIAKKKKS